MMGFTHLFTPTTDRLSCAIVRQLNADEVDPEVGPMYEILVHAYADELMELTAAPLPTAEALMDQLVDILYPLNEGQDSPWDGGDVCEALATIIKTYRPDARYRQRRGE